MSSQIDEAKLIEAIKTKKDILTNTSKEIADLNVRCEEVFLQVVSK